MEHFLLNALVIDPIMLVSFDSRQIFDQYSLFGGANYCNYDNNDVHEFTDNIHEIINVLHKLFIRYYSFIISLEITKPEYFKPNSYNLHIVYYISVFVNLKN